MRWKYNLSITMLIIALQIIIYQSTYPDIFIQQKVFSSMQVRELLTSDFVFQGIWFIFVLILSHFLLITICTQTGHKIGLKIGAKHPATISTLIISISILIIFNLNSIFHPNSIFSTNTTIPKSTIIFIAIIAAAIIFYHSKKLTSISLIIIIAPALSKMEIKNAEAHFSPEQSNIIIISIDSLRPDIININNPKESYTPNISQIASDSYWFTETYTPVARTFPSWMSIITGQLPENHGARFNLTAPDKLNLDSSIATQLQQSGYKTFFATDERRFANITEKMGFDEIIGPPYGVADFMLGKFGDWPLLNLITNLPSASFWLPFNTNNRSAAATYSPERFTKDLIHQVISKQNGGPIFLAVHFCIAHHPFYWQDQRFQPHEQNHNRYHSSIAKADQQIGLLEKELKTHGIINDNTLIILLSDHGETFHEIPDVFTDKETGQEFILDRGGHGTDIRRLGQHHVVMAYKHRHIQPGTSGTLASLTDVAPSLRALIDLPPKSTDGMQLFNANFTPTEHTTADRVLKFESEYNVEAVLKGEIDDVKAALEGASAYRITPEGKVVIRETVFAKLVAEKEFAYWNGETLRHYSNNPKQESERVFHLPQRLTWEIAGEN